jgi:hypothetical protein
MSNFGGENADADNRNIRIRKMRIMVFDIRGIRIRAVNVNNKCGYYLLSTFEVERFRP